ncbi:MAG: extracellular solute-binding protein [Tenericutes bacterium]|nr:extracellular solute-binding protein [Mycoplasmatota bacterium]
MKKIIIALVLVFSAFSILSCGEETTSEGQTTVTTSGVNDTTTQNGTQTTAPLVATYWDEDANGIEDWTEQEITLTYSTWQHTSADVVTIESLMINAFEEKYPNITVEIQMMGASSEEWDANFIAASEAGTLPDAFLVNRIASFLPYNILADMTEYYDNDPDTQYVFDSVSELGMYNEKRYAIPTFIYPRVWIVNLDILDAAGVAAPGYDWTYQQMEAIARATTNENYHIIGTYNTSFYERELAKVLKIEAATTPAELEAANKWQALGFDGTNFHFDDPAFLSAMNMMTDAINEGFLVGELGPEDLEDWYLDSSFEPAYNGKVAMWADASWFVKDYFDQMLFEWDVYPGPNGVTGGNTDIAGISSTSENPKAAYQLLKWMSFSQEGLLTRYQLFEDFSTQVFISANNYGYPVVDYGINGQGVNEIWEKIPYGITAPGFVSPEFIESLKNGAYWINKESVGFDEAYSVAYSYLYNTRIGDTSYAAIKDTLQTEAQAAMENAKEILQVLIDDLNG